MKYARLALLVRVPNYHLYLLARGARAPLASHALAKRGNHAGSKGRAGEIPTTLHTYWGEDSALEDTPADPQRVTTGGDCTGTINIWGETKCRPPYRASTTRRSRSAPKMPTARRRTGPPPSPARRTTAAVRRRPSPTRCRRWPSTARGTTRGSSTATWSST